LYNTYCSVCHGIFARSGGAITDLRLLGEGSHASFNQVVLEGLLAANGMASFADSLTDEDVTRIHAYVRHRAHEDRQVAIGEKDTPRLSWVR
ncbi:MAG: PQQ-dependent dehydrogenase, methanol/ethanol family, partial [Gammaproteobacteria bacterium]|nr:PQQ-dependent dehydrogenase, methanol/ethanol family [Gammaproteobacteria bacterium]